MNIQCWFPLGWTGLISLLTKGLSKAFSSSTVQKPQLWVLSLLYGPTLTSIHDYWKNYSFYYTDQWGYIINKTLEEAVAERRRSVLLVGRATHWLVGLLEGLQLRLPRVHTHQKYIPFLSCCSTSFPSWTRLAAGRLQPLKDILPSVIPVSSPDDRREEGRN